jgi:lipopolysaccharide export system permease protein
VSILDRHLARRFFSAFLPAAACLGGLFLLVDVFEKLRMLLRHSSSGADAALYFAARLPWMASQVAPMAALLAGVLSLLVLGRHGELTALRASGVPLRRVALPYLACGLLVSLGAGLVQETVVPPASAMAREIREVRIRGRAADSLLRAEDLWMRHGAVLVHAELVDVQGGRLFGVSAAETAGHRLRRRLDAPEARWVDGGWTLVEAVVREFAADGTFSTERRGLLPYPLAESPSDLRLREPGPDESSWTQLRLLRDRFRAQGADTESLEVDLWAKTSQPWASLILCALAFPWAVRPRRSGAFAPAVAVSVALGFSYWLLLAVGMSLGRAGALPAPLAAWAANLLFGTAAAAAIWRADATGPETPLPDRGDRRPFRNPPPPPTAAPPPGPRAD